MEEVGYPVIEDGTYRYALDKKKTVSINIIMVILITRDMVLSFL